MWEDEPSTEARRYDLLYNLACVYSKKGARDRDLPQVSDHARPAKENLLLALSQASKALWKSFDDDIGEKGDLRWLAAYDPSFITTLKSQEPT